MVLRRVGGFLEVDDDCGDCRHLLKINAITMLSDSDVCHDTTFITAGGRTIRVPYPLDEVRKVIGLCPDGYNKDQTMDVSTGT